METPEINDDGTRQWIRVWVSGGMALLLCGFLGWRAIGEARFSRELNRPAQPAAWAQTPTTNWPKLVLLQTARFKSHTDLNGGCASLVRLPSGEVVALTAGHLLDKGNGVKPGFVRPGIGGMDIDKLATLDSEIVAWRLFHSDETNAEARVAGLFGKASDLDPHCDQLLLRLSGTNYPVTVLDVRLRPAEAGESLWVIGYEIQDGGLRQVVRSARFVPSRLGFECELLPPAYLDGWSGAPVVDKDGLLVAILTGGTLADFMSSSKPRGFSGHEISEMKPVLKAALKNRNTSANPTSGSSVITEARATAGQK